jgi:CBS domain-containing protein
MNLTVKNIMTKKVVAVHADDLLSDVVNNLFKYGFDGVPVVDNKRKVVGIITQYDLVTKSSGLHLPTIEKIFDDLPVLKKDLGSLKKSFNDIHSLKAKNIMNPEPIVVGLEDSLSKAVKIFTEHHRVNPVPVVDDSGKLVGILSRYDVIKLFELEYFGSAVEDAHASAIQYNNKKLETETGNLLKEMKKEFILVSRWRSRFWYIAAGLFFIAGFVVAFAWVLRVSIK